MTTMQLTLFDGAAASSAATAATAASATPAAAAAPGTPGTAAGRGASHAAARTPDGGAIPRPAFARTLGARTPTGKAHTFAASAGKAHTFAASAGKAHAFAAAAASSAHAPEAAAPAGETPSAGAESPSALERARARRATAAEHYVNQQLDEWSRDAAALADSCPGFELRAALADETFCAMLRAGVPLRQAWFALHAEELLQAAAVRAGRAAEQRVAESIRVRGMRPAENGLGAGGGIVLRPDVSRMSRADRAEVARRAARGERVRLQP